MDESWDLLQHWVIYYSPTDAPGKYVVRQWKIKPTGLEPTTVAYTVDTLTQARARVQEMYPGAIGLARSLSDDPGIVETWV